MKLTLKMALFFLAFASMASQAQLIELKPLPSQPQFSFDPSSEVTVPKCSEIIDRMERIKGLVYESHYALFEFMDETSRIVSGWHQNLSVLEGQTRAIPVGHFSPLQTGAAEISELASMGLQNGGYLEYELEMIIGALDQCLRPQGE